MTNDLTSIADQARKHWPTHFGLLLAEIFIVTLITSVIAVVSATPIVAVILYATGIIIAFLVWKISNRIQKTKKEKIGFVISISTDGQEEQKKIKEDFILTLHELLKTGPSGQSLQIINIPQHIAENIVDVDQAQKLRIKCRAHFIIYGRVRLRSIGGKNEHILHLEGIVSHTPLPKPVSDKLAKEFTELFPRRIRIASENDVLSFVFTSEWINCVARYIIGIAAACSGELDYAEKLQNDVERLLASKDQKFPIFAILKQRVPLRLGEIHFARALSACERWTQNRAPNEMVEVGRNLEKIPPSYATSNYGVILLKSIFMFVQNRDVKGAIAILKKCKGMSNALWHYNLGFLYAYMGDLKKAIQRYRNGMNLPVDPSDFAQIEEFIIWVLEQEPIKYQLYYCLGFINLEIKGDHGQAIMDLEKFLSIGEEHAFAEERKIASKWISEIKES